ncbi:MAG: glycoside hydrolase family 30 protein [Bacteroidales bacterium]|nr:glycoside hydrolase family 30 protein [Bacteroidales bacterium]
MKHFILSFALLSFSQFISAQVMPVNTSGNDKQVRIYTTAQNSKLRLSLTDTQAFQESGQPFETEICVFVDPSKTFQTFLGIGGAITDASAETFFKLPENIQKEIMTAYFDPGKGIGYTLLRTNMNSCDFSSGSYTYVNEGDTDLKTFSIDVDKKFKIPMIKQAMETAGGKIPLYISPWSPPAWMKDNNNMPKGGKLKPEYYQSWANYYVKYINSLENDGVPVWGLSIQNEPMAKQTWESCIYTAEEERDFLKKFLGPTMHKAGLADKNIIMWDHNRDLIYQRAQTYFSDPEVAKYAWGIGFHWYEDWSGGLPVFENVRRVHEAFPEENILFTEGCAESFDVTRYNFWGLGEEYGRAMIHDFNNGSVGWTDWNILLDEFGGPNHVGNFCFAPMHGDTKTGILTYTNSYYYIGHFSKFIRPGAKRIIASPSRSQLITTAFKNTDGSVAVIVMNESDMSIEYKLMVGDKAVQVTSLPHSISTLVF